MSLSGCDQDADERLVDDVACEGRGELRSQMRQQQADVAGAPDEVDEHAEVGVSADLISFLGCLKHGNRLPYEDMTDADGQMLRLMRNRAFQAVNSAWLTLQSAWPADRGRRHQVLAAELMQANRRLAGTVLAGLGMDPALRPLIADTPPLKGRPNWRFLVSHALRGHSVEWFISGRIGMAAGIAGIVSQLIGIGHPYWAIFTATIVINQWMDRIAATRRAAQRAAGTLLGVGVVWTVSATHPSPWWIVVAVLVCAVAQYLTFPLRSR